MPYASRSWQVVCQLPLNFVSNKRRFLFAAFVNFSCAGALVNFRWCFNTLGQIYLLFIDWIIQLFGFPHSSTRFKLVCMSSSLEDPSSMTLKASMGRFNFPNNSCIDYYFKINRDYYFHCDYLLIYNISYDSKCQIIMQNTNPLSSPIHLMKHYKQKRCVKKETRIKISISLLFSV